MIEVVCSVPHSGTRSLVKHLGLEQNSPRGRWLHFGYDPDRPVIRSGAYHLHIPVRDPHQVASSHARRGKNLDALVRAYHDMFESLVQPHTAHNMALVPYLDGADDRDRRECGELYVEHYIETVDTLVVQPQAEWFARILGDDHARDTIRTAG